MQQLHPRETDDIFEVAALLLPRQCGVDLPASSEVTVLTVWPDHTAQSSVLDGIVLYPIGSSSECAIGPDIVQVSSTGQRSMA